MKKWISISWNSTSWPWAFENYLLYLEIKLTKSIQMNSFWREFKQGMTEVKYSLMVERFLFSSSTHKCLYLCYKNKEVSVLNAHNSMSLDCISILSQICLECVSNVSRMCLDCVSNVSRMCLECVLNLDVNRPSWALIKRTSDLLLLPIVPEAWISGNWNKYALIN